MLLVGAALLAHAALILAGVVDQPEWVPICECLIASLLGLHQLRRSEAAAEAANAPSVVPARVESPRAEPVRADVARHEAERDVRLDRPQGSAAGS